MSSTLVHHRFSVDEYEQMIEHGILTENDRVELIRGRIIDKIPIGDPHASCVNRLNRLLGRAFGDDALVTIQNPIRLSDSEPEPDVALVRPREDFYLRGKPRPTDILLLIEVADTTLEFDREQKLPMYAEAGIAEYWIVNLNDECLEVHRQPLPDGRYRDVRALRRGEEIDVAALPGIKLRFDEMI